MEDNFKIYGIISCQGTHNFKGVYVV